MCGFCGMFREAHWAEDDSSRRERAFRVGVINDVLGSTGLRVRDFGGAQYTLSDGKGRTALARSIDEVWVAAERMLGRPVDPLAGS